MNRTRTFLPLTILIIGLFGLFSLPLMICFDGGLFSDLNISRESDYKNTEGAALYTMDQVRDHLEIYTKARSGIWALDILSIYMVFHGAFGLTLNRKEIATTLREPGGKKSLLLHLITGIPTGFFLVYLIVRLIWQVGMPLH